MTLTTARLDELALLYPADTDPLNAAVIEAARESVARQECEALLPEDAFLRCGHALKPREEGLFINGWTGCGCFLLILLPIFLVGVGFGMAAVR